MLYTTVCTFNLTHACKMQEGITPNMKMNNKIIGIVIAAIVLIGAGVFALNSGDDDTKENKNNEQTSQTTQADLPFNFSVGNLSPLESGIYEGWVVRGDAKYSFGTFNTDASSNIVGDLKLDNVTPQDGDKIVVTIEPVPDDSPDPSPTVVLAGDVVSGAATLSFPVDVSNFAGKYILATPSNGDNTTETAGVWFLSLETGSITTGLDLPVAPDGWIYEGWAVYNGVPLTTGQFKDPAAADNFDGYTGPESVPALPGEDFIVNLPEGTETPVDLANGSSKIVISLEPYINGSDPTGEGPAQVKPLVADVAAGAADHETFNMMLDTSSLPTGSASL